MAVGDLDGDGWVDVVVATAAAPGAAAGKIYLWRQLPGPH